MCPGACVSSPGLVELRRSTAGYGFLPSRILSLLGRLFQLDKRPSSEVGVLIDFLIFFFLFVLSFLFQFFPGYFENVCDQIFWGWLRTQPVLFLGSYNLSILTAWYDFPGYFENVYDHIFWVGLRTQPVLFLGS